MCHFICYFKENKKDQEIRNLLNSIFNYGKYEITEISSGFNHGIRYETRILDESSEFKSELNVYISEIKTVLENEIYNDLLFGLVVSKFLKEDIIVNDQSDDPYQWILIRDGGAFLVEEAAGDNKGINVFPNSERRLDINKSLCLFPDINYVRKHNTNKGETAYFIVPSTLWNSSLEVI